MSQFFVAGFFCRPNVDDFNQCISSNVRGTTTVVNKKSYQVFLGDSIIGSVDIIVAKRVISEGINLKFV